MENISMQRSTPKQKNRIVTSIVIITCMIVVLTSMWGVRVYLRNGVAYRRRVMLECVGKALYLYLYQHDSLPDNLHRIEESIPGEMRKHDFRMPNGYWEYISDRKYSGSHMVYRSVYGEKEGSYVIVVLPESSAESTRVPYLYYDALNVHIDRAYYRKGTLKSLLDEDDNKRRNGGAR